jgi:hypothetical protein
MSMIIDGTSGLTFNNSTIQSSAALVLQIVSVNFDTSFATTSGTYVSTGHTATITPKFASSKILVLLSTNLANANTNSNSVISITRNGTSISGGGTTSFGNILSSAGNIYSTASVNYLDSPASASALTYTVTLAAQSVALPFITVHHL